MTIAAGFHCQDGVLLCADSMYVGGTKVHQPKLFGYVVGGQEVVDSCSFAIALAGHENYGKMAIEDCVEEIKNCPADRRSARNIKQALRKAVKKINDDYVDTRPESHERENAKFDLIIAAWLPRGGGLRMFKSSGPAVLDADSYHCTGIGAYLGDYLMHNVFNRSMRVQDAALLAIQALSATKAYDSNCGGDTQFITISPGGALSNVVPYDVHTSEGYISDFERASRKLLFALGNLNLDDGDFRAECGEFIIEVDRLRAFWRGAGFDYMAKMLEILKEAKQSAPGSTTHDPKSQPPSRE